MTDRTTDPAAVLKARNSGLITAEVFGQTALRPAKTGADRTDIDFLARFHDLRRALLLVLPHNALRIMHRQCHSHNFSMHSADMEKSDRLRMAREAAGFATGTDAASALGMKVATYLGHENGSRGYGAVAAATYGRRFKVDPSWLLFGTGKGPSGDASMTMGFATRYDPTPNALIKPGPVTFDPNEKIPVYGHAVGGSEGQFPLNGNKIEDVLAPPALRGVRNAYGVMVAGDSMEPRYYAGETVYVNPGVSVRRGDFVVAQIRGDDPATPDAYVKRFVRKNAHSLTLSQFNPEQELTFDADRVVSVHRIVMGG